MLAGRAEDFCKNPEATMNKCVRFLADEPYCEMDYNKVQQVTIENDRISDFGIIWRPHYTG
jgi:hypothetical protein